MIFENFLQAPSSTRRAVSPAIEQASKTRQNRPERVQICVFISIYVCHAQFFIIYPRIFTFVLFCYCCCFCWSRLFDPTDRWMLSMWWLSSLAYRLYVKKYTEIHSISKKLEKREWKLSKSNYKLRKNVPLISTFRISGISSKKTASTHIVSYAFGSGFLRIQGIVFFLIT